jgi:hypothetical protein
MEDGRWKMEDGSENRRFDRPEQMEVGRFFLTAYLSVINYTAHVISLIIRL